MVGASGSDGMASTWKSRFSSVVKGLRLGDCRGDRALRRRRRDGDGVSRVGVVVRCADPDGGSSDVGGGAVEPDGGTASPGVVVPEPPETSWVVLEVGALVGVRPGVNECCDSMSFVTRRWFIDSGVVRGGREEMNDTQQAIVCVFVFGFVGYVDDDDG